METEKMFGVILFPNLPRFVKRLPGKAHSTVSPWTQYANKLISSI